MGRPLKKEWDREKAARRFWKRVKKGPLCWEWQGGVTQRAGRGQVCWRRSDGTWTMMRAHRVALHLVRGFDLESKVNLGLTCANPICVRPRHMYRIMDGEKYADR